MTPEERARIRKEIDAEVRRRCEKRDNRRFCIDCGEIVKECSCQRIVDDLMLALKRT